MKSLPKDLYITIEEQGTDDEWLNTHRKLNDAAPEKVGDERLVGHYVLKRTLTVSTNIEISEK